MAADANPTDSMATCDHAVTSQSVEEGVNLEPELGDRPVNDSRQEILKRKEHKWRRNFESAFDTLMRQFMDFADDVIDSNEELPEDSGKPHPYPNESLPGEQASTNGKVPGQIEDGRVQIESKSDINVSYRAEFYHYTHEYQRGKTPRFERSVLDKNPIRTIHARDLAENSKDSIFEITTMYAVPELDPYNFHKKPCENGTSQAIEVLADVGTYMTIRSKFVLDILRDIVHYHPSLSARAKELALQEPFSMLLHYREELAERRDDLKQVASDLASPEGNASSTAHEHLAYLTDFLHQRYADAMSQETARHRETHAMCTYDWVWLLFRPGSIVYSWDRNTLRAHIVEEHDRRVGAKTDGKIRPKDISDADDEERLPPPGRLEVLVWTLDFDGERLGRRRRTVSIPAFDGEKSILSLPIFPKEHLKYDKRVHHNMSTEDFLIQRGKMFFEMARRNYREYHGETVTVPRRTIRGRVMIDTKAYYDENGSRPPRLGLTPRRTDEAELRYPEAPVHPDVVAEEKIEGSLDFTDPYRHYDDIDPYKCESLEPEQYLICENKVWAFELKTREWELLDVGNICQPDFQVDLIKDLVLDEDAKAMIKALSHRYTMQSQNGNAWSADFVSNKGEGQIFLLHGKPGVGKTTTAECVAEITRRPLLSLTCGDLGMEPYIVEKQLMKWLKLATSWEAILLLDEADVYLESRISQDLQRNTLVSIFLRALEYYQGLLFLTTNRVGTFDDAFVSRIHVVIHYPDFTNGQRAQIWDTFFNKLEKEKESIKFTQRTVDYAKESKEIQSLGWNGREIRNAFNTAVGLAEYENERDGKQRVVFHARHLEQVVKMSRAFQDYLSSTHGMSQAEQARTYRTRNDYWKGPSDRSVGSGAI